MAFTYSATNLTTDLAKVRRLIGDTDSANPLFTDEELDFIIDEEPTIYGAAAVACEALAAEYSIKVDKSVGDLKLSLSQKHEQFLAMAKRFRELSKRKGSVQLFAGGISTSDKTSRESDSDRPAPDFYKGQFDNPGVSSSTD